MKEHAIEGDYRQWVVNALRQSALFAGADQARLDKVIARGVLIETEPNEFLVTEGRSPDALFLVIMGEFATFMVDRASGEAIDLGRLGPVDTIGESALLLNSNRTASAVATRKSYALRFDHAGFEYIMERVPGFPRQLSRILAKRMVEASRRLPMTEVGRAEFLTVDAATAGLLPEAFVHEHHALPLAGDGRGVTVGFVDRPDRALLDQVREKLDNLTVRPVRISKRDFDYWCEGAGIAPAAVIAEAVVHHDMPAAGVHRHAGGARPAPVAGSAGGASRLPAGPLKRRLEQISRTTSVVASLDQLHRLEPILRQMVDAGASDIHISAAQRPRWRIDGDIHPIPDVGVPSEQELYEILEPMLSERAYEEFHEHHDCDFAFGVEGLARFRVNMFRDEHGIGAVFRLVPQMIPAMDQLGMSQGAQRLTDLKQGLVLVCGPTGSGKSTTLAAMLDHINNTRRSHIITIEDPIEFNHDSKVSMITQREVGKNTSGFHRALRAALREDPDIVLVGELRDIETVSLAMHTAQTGHLVLSTLHTNTAIGTIDRMVDYYRANSALPDVNTAEDVGSVAAFLCSPLSAAITGETLHVDMGYHIMGMPAEDHLGGV